MKRIVLALLLGVLACREALAAEPVVAVFASEIGPFLEVLAGLRQNPAIEVQPFFLTRGEPKIPRPARVILAFGSKAAVRKYPEEATLIYGMVPGLAVERPHAVQICMEPEPFVLLKNLRRIQPGLKRLGILWRSARFEAYVERLRGLGVSLGVAVESAAMENGKDIPDRLRRVYGKVDAIWLPPDPLLLTGASLPVFVEFSRANHVPLYVPTGGLVEQGATASVGPSFREIGRLAALAAQNALEAKPEITAVYAAKVEIVINKKSAAQAGLQIPEEVLGAADKALP